MVFWNENLLNLEIFELKLILLERKFLSLAKAGVEIDIFGTEIAKIDKLSIFVLKFVRIAKKLKLSFSGRKLPKLAKI